MATSSGSQPTRVRRDTLGPRKKESRLAALRRAKRVATRKRRFIEIVSTR
jgi:membrane protein involved in colicin uptake